MSRFFVSLIICMFGFINFANADIIADPFGIALSIEVDDTMAVDLTLTNDGDQDVLFKIVMRDPPDEEEERDNIGRNVRKIHGVPYRVDEGGRLVDGSTPGRDGRGDDGEEDGVEWRDNEENDGPDFEWIDVPELDGAQQLNPSDDWNSGQIQLGFEMPWYGEMYGIIRICSNGWITFDPNYEGRDYAYPWVRPPTAAAPNSLLVPMGYDLHPARGDGGSMWFWTNEEDLAVAQWDNVPSYRNANIRHTFQVVFNGETGLVTFQYGEQQNVDNQMTNIGYENQNGQIGASILYQEEGLEEGLAIGIGTADAFGPKWVTAEPVEGVISANESTDIELTFAPVEMEDGVYEARVVLELSAGDGDDAEQWFIETSAVLSVSSPTFDVTGVVTDPAQNDAVVRGVAADLDRYIIRRYSDEDGAFAFDELPTGEYELTFTATDYLPLVEAFEAGEDEDIELNIALLHSECIPDPEAIVREIGPDFSIDLTLDVHNAGNGPLTWTVERKLLGDANAEPWVLRNSLYVGEEVDDTYIMGAIFDGVNFYVSGSNDNSPVIYIFDREGNLQDSFDQPGDDRRGLRDLAWDGNLIWGADSDNIYVFLTGQAKCSTHLMRLSARLPMSPGIPSTSGCG